MSEEPKDWWAHWAVEGLIYALEVAEIADAAVSAREDGIHIVLSSESAHALANFIAPVMEAP